MSSGAYRIECAAFVIALSITQSGDMTLLDSAGSNMHYLHSAYTLHFCFLQDLGLGERSTMLAKAKLDLSH